MTEEEKQRLSELLSDLDTVTEEHTVEVRLGQSYCFQNDQAGRTTEKSL